MSNAVIDTWSTALLHTKSKTADSKMSRDKKDVHSKSSTSVEKQEAQLSLTNRAMLVCKSVEVVQEFL